ncbi:hypothetical protein A176_002046 [Myxococcus hansupus]|uniref:Uncharacterized protein n=1 Tax=Pseudomyxococcus hansupus TaxID=1297742 RepID=A0A0H4WQV0_9BACT|nr:hypothetical protein A176_002046 [Myxococcus hansupus]
MKTPAGGRRFRPKKAHGDKAYASKKNRRELHRCSIARALPVLG